MWAKVKSKAAETTEKERQRVCLCGYGDSLVWESRIHWFSPLTILGLRFPKQVWSAEVQCN